MKDSGLLPGSGIAAAPRAAKAVGGAVAIAAANSRADTRASAVPVRQVVAEDEAVLAAADSSAVPVVEI